MHRTTLELMCSHVREIHEALTGTDLPDESTAPPVAAQPLSADGVLRLFSDLEAAARTDPAVSERIPPFAFAPPVDLFEDESELIAQLAVPGVEQDDVAVEVRGDVLTISGARDGRVDQHGYHLLHAEIARGPFWRALRLPYGVKGEPRVELHAGLVRIHLTKSVTHSS